MNEAVNEILWAYLAQTAQYAAVGAIVIGGLVRLIKADRFPLNVPPWLRPWLAVALGGGQVALESLAMDLPLQSAILHGSVAAMGAIFGHETIIEGLRKGRELGVSKDALKKAAGGAIVLLAFGCTPAQQAGVIDAITKVARGVAWISGAADVAETGSSAFFARYPNLEAQTKVAQAIHAVRQSIEVLSAAVATADSQSIEQAKQRAIETYSALYRLLDSLGVADAIPSVGGADGNAPNPERFALPSPSVIAQAM